MSDNHFGVTPLDQHGGRRPGAGRPRKGAVRHEKKLGTLKPKFGSNSSAYIRARLERDSADGVTAATILLGGIRDGKISTFAAGCEMNYTQRPEPNGRGSENATRRRDWAMHRLFNPNPKPRAPEKALDVASSTEGREEHVSGSSLAQSAEH